MAGVTDDVFRRLCLEQGAAFVYSEMVSAKALHYGDAKSLSLLVHSHESSAIAYQLFGSEPAIMAEAVARLDDLGRGDGRLSCASYDVNMGCPVPKVVKNGEGSALMKDPDKAARIVEAMARATDKPVTVKMRAGWDAATSAASDAAAFAQAMEQAGAAAIAVHGRTREQYYGGAADRGVIARVGEAVSVPVIGSGDVMSAADAVCMLSGTGCDYVMIARGALGNPWIFSEAIARWERPASRLVGDDSAGRDLRPGAQERARMFLRHARLLEADKGARVAVREMRGHAGWYFKGLPGASAFRAKVNAAQTMTELTELLSYVI
jgi:tRNA-dihydrouridine synthase B